MFETERQQAAYLFCAYEMADSGMIRVGLGRATNSTDVFGRKGNYKCSNGKEIYFEYGGPRYLKTKKLTL